MRDGRRLPSLTLMSKLDSLSAGVWHCTVQLSCALLCIIEHNTVVIIWPQEIMRANWWGKYILQGYMIQPKPMINRPYDFRTQIHRYITKKSKWEKESIWFHCRPGGELMPVEMITAAYLSRISRLSANITPHVLTSLVQQKKQIKR